ncbi:MAG: hypothetical protein ACLQNE_37110 [Thermoguttaceae bacterium]
MEIGPSKRTIHRGSVRFFLDWLDERAQWMGDALADVVRQVPDLAGVYAITASENPTNCDSRGDWRH